MIDTLLDACNLVLKEQGEPQSPYWLSSLMHEMMKAETFLIWFILPGATLLPSAISASQIEWDQTTLTLIQRNAGYGRIIRLAEDQLLSCFGHGRSIAVRTSDDNGRTWEPLVYVAGPRFGVATNPTLIRLANGTILCFYNERPDDGKHPFTIMSVRSDDRGKSWSSPRQLFAADVRFENGCWEPDAIQLPSGELQLFFANESPYRSSAEQEITLLRSHDNGANWTQPQTISFREGHRDGMPVPLVLRDGKGIVVAIEDNGLNGRFKPVIVHTSVAENWQGPSVIGDSGRRWSALQPSLPPNVYAGAPYVCQMPTGSTILSVQSDEGGRSQPQMVVYIGDSNAKNFSNKSVPFQVAPNISCLWNSLFVKDSDTVTAISGTTIRGARGVWSIDGRFVETQSLGTEPGVVGTIKR